MMALARLVAKFQRPTDEDLQTRIEAHELRLDAHDSQLKEVQRDLHELKEELGHDDD